MIVLLLLISVALPLFGGFLAWQVTMGLKFGTEQWTWRDTYATILIGTVVLTIIYALWYTFYHFPVEG